jgi:hypothetical protein
MHYLGRGQERGALTPQSCELRPNDLRINRLRLIFAAT